VSGWIILSVYALAFPFFLRSAIRHKMAALDRATEQFHPYEDIKAAHRRDDRAFYLVAAILLAIFRPVTVPFSILWRALMSADFARTPVELAQAERQELEQLRELARKYDLPMPGQDGGAK